MVLVMFPKDVPSFEFRSAQVTEQVTKELSKKTPRIRSHGREWLSAAQYAERENISLSASTKRLARAFTAKYYELPKLADDPDNKLPIKEDDLFYGDYLSNKLPLKDFVVRCVPSAKGTKKYEVLLASLPDFKPCQSDESVNDADAYSHEIHSFLEHSKPKIFCDWITMSQRHPALVNAPNKTGGLFLVLNNSGELLYDFRDGDDDRKNKTDFLLFSPKEDLQSIAYKYFQCEGSWDSRVFIRAMDGRVDLHGNIGKYGRPDNLFGYSLEECIEIANKLLVENGLPPFTAGNFIEPYFDNDDNLVSGWTGATFSRIDLTTNISFGNPDDVKEYLGWLATQHISRMRNHVHPDGNTVEIGLSDGGGKSKYLQMVAYNKAVEFQKHSEKHMKKMLKRYKKGLIELDLDYTNDYYEKLAKYMNEMGVARLELRLKRDYLHQHETVRYLGYLEKDFNQLNQVFIDRWTTATRDFQMKEINQMSTKEKEVYAQYLAGVDLSLSYPKKTTFYRKRNLLLPYGIDISVPYQGDTTAPKISGMRALKVRSLPMPEFYYLPQVQAA